MSSGDDATAPGSGAGLFVRSAAPEDSELLVHHEEAMARESSRYRGERWIAPADSPPIDSVSLVAGVGSTVFASLLATTADGKNWWIERIHVEEDAREVGLGDALMRTLVATVSRRGGIRIGSSAQPGDRSLKNLFERHGLVARTILVGKDLEQAGE